MVIGERSERVEAPDATHGAGQSHDIAIDVRPDAWSWFDAANQDLVTRDGTYEMAVAEHAEDPGHPTLVDITDGRPHVRRYLERGRRGLSGVAPSVASVAGCQ